MEKTLYRVLKDGKEVYGGEDEAIARETYKIVQDGEGEIEIQRKDISKVGEESEWETIDLVEDE